MTEVKVLGRVRKLLEGFDAGAPGDEEQITLSAQLETLVAAGRSPYGEITRMGRAFTLSTTAAAAAVVPAALTTTAGFAIYNGEADGGRSYVIDWASSTNIVTTTTVAAQAILMGLVGQIREAAPTDSGLVAKKTNGLGGLADSRVKSILTATTLPATTGIASNWFPIATNGIKPNVVASTGNVGYGCFAQIDGRFIIPPGRYFALQTLAQATTETFVYAIGWHEVQLQLG